MDLRSSSALIVSVIIGGGFYLYGKTMEIHGPNSMPMTIAVSADAKVSASPDIAMLSFGIQTGRQPSAKVAMDIMKKNMAAVIEAVKKAGVEEKDIATESFWLSPAYDYVTGSQVPRGFEASQSLRVKVRDLDKAGDVLSAATAAGANQAGSINFSIDNPDALNAAAREKAIEKAKAKAEVLAKNLGMSLGRMVGFSEGGYGMPMPMMMGKANMDMGGGAMAETASVPLPPGEQEVQTSVTLSYELR